VKPVEELTMREQLRGQRPMLAALLALVLLGCADKMESDVKADLEQAQEHMKAARWCEARIALARAEGRLSRGGTKELRKRVEQMQKDIDMVQRLDALRLGRAAGKGAPDAGFAEAFRAYGLDLSKLKPEDASAQLRASPVREKLLAALHLWAVLKPAGDDRKALLEVLDASDENPWRKRLRQAIKEKDSKALKSLAGDAETDRQSPAMLVLLTRALSSDEAIKVLRRAQQRHPADFWLNHALGELLSRHRAGRDEAVGYYRAALALRPHSAPIYIGLGNALFGQGKADEAITAFRQAIRLRPDHAAAHANLGAVLAAKGQMAEAIACYRRAIRLDPKSASAYVNLGTALQQTGKLAEAIAAFRAAIELDPQYANAHASLGGALAAVGRIQEAIACFRKAIELDPKNASAHLRLGTTLMQAGKLDEAIAGFRKAIALDPKYAHAYFNLGHALRTKGQLDEAIACYRKALALHPDLAPAKKALEEAMKAKGER
jgi:tetratricopeptide (TPR) repeat protein